MEGPWLWPCECPLPEPDDPESDFVDDPESDFVDDPESDFGDDPESDDEDDEDDESDPPESALFDSLPPDFGVALLVELPDLLSVL